jgi:hypothetical protein
VTAPRGERRTGAPGLGDRWMAGEPIPGVAFAQHDPVHVADGPHAGRVGRVLLLAAPPPAAAYLIAIDGDGGAPVRVPQADLRAAS